MTTATPKPRAGEHTPMTTNLIDDMLHGAGIPRCDEWDKLVRHSRALEASVYRGISDIERIEAERDSLREREKALIDVLGKLLDVTKRANIEVPMSDAPTFFAARDLLAKHGAKRSKGVQS